jgi:hypothetical protein
MLRPFKKILIILGIDKDRPALDTADDNVMKCPRGINTGFPGHVDVKLVSFSG